MNFYLFSLNAVLPTFLIILLGAFIRKKELISKSTVMDLNTVLYNLFIPILLINSIYATPISEMLNIKLILFSVTSILLIWGSTFIIISLLENNPSKRGAMIQGIFRSNFLFFGIPIFSALYPQEDIGIVGFMIAIIIPLLNILASFTLELTCPIKISSRWTLLFKPFINPLFIGPVIGIIIIYLGIPIPSTIAQSMTYISELCTPLALIIIGATIKKDIFKEDGRRILIATLGKLVFVPLAVFPCAIYFGFHGIEIAIILGIFAAPTSITSYMMAVNTKCDLELTTGIIVFTTMFSCFSLALWIVIFLRMNLL